jgi:hypothetical protein
MWLKDVGKCSWLAGGLDPRGAGDLSGSLELVHDLLWTELVLPSN